ncbi:NYN domain-containing protein [Demequina rhizosphaerae]|uniref:NYN domain-containing protein n=1 Tax=Demequina rhizosphaerae TaxID=1638985 RepID=UPI000784DB80|nr:NYN domain-containing protein [Demequina rhizosphaerae]
MKGTHRDGGRRLVVVDLENLLGCAPELASDACWALALSSALDAVGYAAGRDQLVVGVGPDWVFTAADLAPGARVVTRAGESGADLALCACLEDVDLVAARFDSVVIASGDHEFVRPVLRLLGAGVPAVVAALPLSASTELTYYASDTVWLERPARTLGEAAHVASAAGMGRVALAA